MVTQIILVVFLLFAVSRVLLQLKQRNLTLTNFIFWGTIFLTAIIGVVKPEVTSQVASLLGIGRGADVVVYFSIVVLFYLIFRLTISLEELRYEMTNIIRIIALKNVKKKRTKKRKD